MTLANTTEICRALGDDNRFAIIKMLTKGELCACKILEAFEITQPTLSHHMKILSDCNLVNTRREGKRTHYSLNCETIMAFKEVIASLTCKTCCSKSEQSGCCDK